MKIQVDIPEGLNKKLKIYKIQNDLHTLQEALVDILEEHFKNEK